MLLRKKLRFGTLLALLRLCVISHGYSDSEYLIEESQRLEKYVEKLKESLNKEVDPCENFLEYLNNSKAEDLALPETTYSYLYETIMQQPINPELMMLIKNFHLSSENMPVEYFDAVKNLNINDEIISFPILDRNWEKYNLSLADYEGRLMPYRANLFISGEAIKTKNGDYKFKIEPKYQFSVSEDMIIEVLEHHGVDSDEANNTVYGEMRQFNYNYYRKFLDYSKMQNHKKMTLGELKEKYPNFIWDRYFAIISGGADFNDNAEVSVLYEDKLSYFHDLFPSKVNRTVALYYLFNLHQHFGAPHIIGSLSKDYFSTVQILSDPFTDEVLKNFVNPHDAISFTDTATAISKAPNIESSDAIYLEAIKELVSHKDDYSKNLANVYGQITADKDNYLSNYVKIMAAKKLRAVPEEFTTDYTEALPVLTFAHLKPRFVLLVIWGLRHSPAFYECSGDKPEECIDLYFSSIKNVMDYLDNLEQLDNEKYQNDLNTLVKHGLTPRKLLYLILGQHYRLHGRNATTVQRVIRTQDSFNTEFNCSNYYPSPYCYYCD